MAGSFAIPNFRPAEIAASLHCYRIAPSNTIGVEEIENPRPCFVADVLKLFLVNYAGYEPDAPVNFQALQALDNLEQHARALELMEIYKRANAFLQTIHFRDLNLRDLLRADRGRVITILSALINFLTFREERLALLRPIILQYGPIEERKAELTAKIAELRKVKEDHLLKEQMEASADQQLEKEVNDLKERLREYNREQLALRAEAKALDEKKDETLRKLNQAEFELVKAIQEKKKLSDKIVQSPEKLQRNLEEKRTVRDQLKKLEKMAMQKVQEGTDTLEMYTKVSEKLVKYHSEISAVQEKSAAAKISEKDVKAHKEKISNQNLEIKALRSKAADGKLKLLENEANLKSKEKERDQRVGENNRKMAALKSEIEAEHKCLDEKERKIKEKIEKGSGLCSQADTVAEAGRKKVDEINLKYNQVCEASLVYLEGIEDSFDEDETD